MKKILYLFIPMLFLMLSSSSYSGQGTPFAYNDNDSLLFDGANENVNLVNIADYSCRIVVDQAHGAKGDIVVKKVENICGQPDTVWEIKKNVTLKPGDMLAEGSEVKTDAKGEASMIMIIGPAGGEALSEFAIGHNSTIGLPNLDQLCSAIKKKIDPGQLTIDFNKGNFFYKSSNQYVNQFLQAWHDAGSVVMHGVNSVIGHVNTQFSVEVSGEGDNAVDIVKVYEGSVNIKLKTAPPSSKNNTKERIDQLNDDFKNGKITKEEYQSKLMEITQNLTTTATDMLPQDVEAGNKCTVTKSSLKVEPIESNDDRWWEDVISK
jgi:hypothetical protein